MYERTYGYLYDRNRSVKEDAALIRRNVKTMTGAGVLPEDWTYSVRYRCFSGGCAIDVRASSPRPVLLMDPGFVAASKERDRLVTVPRRRRSRDDCAVCFWALDQHDQAPKDHEYAPVGPWMNLHLRAGEQHDIFWEDAATPEALAVQAALQELLDACNHDGSDSMVDYFDVKFYGHATVDAKPGVPRAERERRYLPSKV